MRKTIQMLWLAFGLLGMSVTLPILAAEHFVQVGPGLTFSPQNLTIQVGDTVTWTNAGGFHNVEANDGSFRCANGCDGMGGSGEPAANDWSFSLVFDEVRTINYVCIVHVGQGMTGTLNVQGAQQEEPGDLRFAQATRQVGEGGGTVSLTVNRVGGNDGAVTVSYATSNGSAQAGTDYTQSGGTLAWADGDSGARTILVPILDDGATESNETFNVTLSSPTGGAGLGSPSSATVTITDNDDETPSPGTLAFVSTEFEVGEDAGPALINVTRSGGSDGAVSVSFATGDGSATAGDDYQASSGTLDWADGDAAPKSFTVPVLDDLETEGDETVNLTLSNPTGGATLGQASAATLTIDDDDDPPAGDCVPGAETLCLNENGRFEVTVRYRDFDGNEGAGQAVDIGKRDSGLVFFFSEDNIEMLIKVLNACGPPFDAYWVFLAATTNVEYTVTVTDTREDVVNEYSNALGNPAEPVLDTAAFPTCP